MRLLGYLGVAAALAACGEAPLETPGAATMAVVDAGASEARLEADVRFLADDLLEGREAGQRGYDIAALYVAERFRALGLEPIGEDGTYFQEVPLRSFTPTLPGGAVLAITGPDGVTNTWKPGAEFVGSSLREAALIGQAPLVFVGYGFVSEEHGRDDYQNLDVEGAVVVSLAGAPKTLNSEERAYHSAQRNRYASERGAIGMISLMLPSFEEQRYPFERLAEQMMKDPVTSWVREDGSPSTNAPRLLGSITMGQVGAAKLFDAVGADWSDIVEAAETDDGLVPGFTMDLTASMRFENNVTNTKSPNVLGFVPGTDPALSGEVVMVTAHLDHEGNQAPGADAIYNGAMDNAVGTAALMEAARSLIADPPARPVLFVALTAEEKGLLGSDYLANNSVTEGQVVANINLDMPVLTFPFVDMVAFGAERSTLGPVVAAATESLGVTLSPDPIPEQGIFTRSDHYSFVKKGVPAVFLFTGFGGEGAEAFPHFLSTHYHQPSDEIDLVMFDQLDRFAELNTAIIRDVANMDETPVWNAGDFFGTTFEGPMASE
ncbi:MAG: M28 family peptidase [Pseudomonadota bacterium]